MGRLSEIYNEVLLIEGRLEKAKERYPEFANYVIEFFAHYDPSGNQKYLDWMLGLVDDMDKSLGSDFKQGEPDLQIHRNIIRAVKFFHENQQRFKQRDINQYKDLVELNQAIEVVKENIKQKELEKQHKKERDIIYKDDRWFVVSPKSHAASCTYGAGTRWCVTMKNDDQYWNRYTRNANFFFILDKTKPQSDPMYKVAYRMIGGGGKYELWDASDREFSKNANGIEYIEELPPELRIKINEYHEENFTPSDGKHLEGDPRGQAIARHLGDTDIEDIDDTWYGVPIYEADNGFWCAADSGELDDALYDNYSDYYDGDLMGYYDPDGYYLDMDVDDFIDTEISEYISNVSDIEIIEFANKDDEFHEVNNAYDEEEDDDEIERLSALMEDILEESKQIVADVMEDEWKTCFRDGVKECLVDNKGWYRNAHELYQSGIVNFDRDGLIDSLVGNSEYDEICHYGYSVEEDDEGNTWYVFEVDY